MGTIQFEKINGGVAYTTYFYKNDSVNIAAGLIAGSRLTAASTNVAMWSGQPTTITLDVTKIRSVEVYLDADDDNLSNGLADFKYIGTDAFPTGADIEAGKIYVRINGTSIDMVSDTTQSNLILVVVTD